MATKEFNVKLALLSGDFASKLKGAVSNVEKSSKKMVDSLGTVGKSFKTIGAQLSIAITVPLTILGKQMLKFASEAESVNGKFSASFGKSANFVEDNLSNIASSLGRSETDLKSYASNMGNILQSMDFAQESAGELSSKLVTLAIDVASLRGATDGEVMEKFTTALTGSTKGLKDLGVYINDAKIKAEAFNLGLNNGEDDLTDFAKASAVASLLQKEFANDLGNTKKSSNDFSEILTRISTVFSDIATQLGTRLKPPLIWLEDKIKTLKGGFDQLTEGAKDWIVQIGIGAAVAPPFILTLGTFAGAINSIFVAYNSLSVAVIVASKAIWGFVAATAAVAWSAFLSGLTLVAEGFVFLSTTVLPIVVIIASVVQIVRMAIQAFSFFAGIIADNAQTIVKYLGPALLLLLKHMEQVINTSVFLANIGKGFDEASRIAMESTFSINKTIGELQQELNDPNKYHGISDGIRDQATKAEMYLVNMGENFDQTLKDIPRNIVDVTSLALSKLKAFMSEHWSEAKNGFKGTVDFIVKMWDAGAEKIKQKLKEIAVGAGVIKPNEAPKNPSQVLSLGGPSEADLQFPNKPQIDNQDKAQPFGSEDNIKKDFEMQKTLWQEWADHIGTVIDTVQQTVIGLYDSLYTGFGQAIGDMIVDGKNFAESMKSVFNDMVKNVISALVKMAAQWVANSLIATTASGTQALAVNANNASTAATGAASSQASIPFVGPILAIAAMAAMFASVIAMNGKVKLAKGGITQGPTNALIGEAGQEAVIPLDRLDTMMGNREQKIQIILDGRTLAQSVIKNSPREIRLSTGVTM